jgi:hypothetical protein
MNPERDETGFAGMGRWLAIGSELPCSVVALLLVGQVIGQSTLGPTGGMTGALVGAVLGFFIGIYSVYATVGYYEKMEVTAKARRTYMPPEDEIFRDVKFDIPDESE